MPTYRLVAKVDHGSDESFLVRSPAVGVADGVPSLGVYLNPSEGFLRLNILGRRYVVQLPRNIQGTVTEQLIEDSEVPVGYGQPLFRLSPVRELGTRGAEGAAAGGKEHAADDLIAVTAPSDGVFYRKPTPESPCYVEEGSAVTTGSVLGLVEVMKSFNQIAYGAPGLPERGTVAKVLVQDAVEVAFGQTLFLVRPS
jgi:acetyl-CoA carboxylase biotin carboxyl carrier protein